MKKKVSRAGRPLPVRALRKEMVGVRIPKNLLRPADKGALGRMVEDLLRATPALRGRDWASPTASRPDVDGFDVKTAQFAPSARVPGGFRATQDLALAMLSPQALELPASRSPVVRKSNIILVCLLEKARHFVIVDLVVHELARDPRVRLDYRRLRQGYLEGVRSGRRPREVIAGLGQGTIGAGQVCKAKTKGPGRAAARSRAWYARRGFVQDLVRPRMGAWRQAHGA